VAHALFFTELLNAQRRCTTGVNGSRLLMAGGFSDHGEALLISSEIHTTALEQINKPDGTRCGFGHHVLVAKEGPASNGVFSMAAVI
jgi:hypothetical protein